MECRLRLALGVCVVVMSVGMFEALWGIDKGPAGTTLCALALSGAAILALALAYVVP